MASAENWLALGSAAVLLMYGALRRTPTSALGAIAATPLLYRGITGRWPTFLADVAPEDTKAALSGDRGVRIHESIRLELPRDEVYRFWRRLENLPRFMSHLASVAENPDGRSHWVAVGPADYRVEWDAEIINEIPNQTLAWRSLPGSDVVSAGSVNFDSVRGGRSTQLSVNLQYAPPAGRAGDLVARLFGRAPVQIIREDLRRFKQLLEAGEIAQARAEKP
jgi:uncharacterized membrane protein